MNADHDRNQTDRGFVPTRRRFLGGVSAAGLTAVFGLSAGSTNAAAHDDTNGGEMMDPEARMREAYETRMELAEEARREGIPSMAERTKLGNSETSQNLAYSRTDRTDPRRLSLRLVRPLPAGSE